LLSSFDARKPLGVFSRLAPSVLSRKYFELVCAVSFRSVSGTSHGNIAYLVVVLPVFSVSSANSVRPALDSSFSFNLQLSTYSTALPFLNSVAHPCSPLNGK